MSDDQSKSEEPVSAEQTPMDSQSSDPRPKSSSPPSTSAQSPAQPLTDFMGMLKMKRSKEEADGSGERVKERRRSSGERDREEKMEAKSSSDQDVTLVELFRRDPESVLKLLESALSTDKLSSLLTSTHQQDKKKLEEHRSKLEAAYHTLKDCAEQKKNLSAKIETTNEKIKTKRKQLEGLREELKVLGEEELKLKRKRDASYTHCADLKKKLKCSRDAMQQLTMIAKASNKSSASGEGSQNI